MSKIKVLGVIPARGGSKGIPRKNLYPLNGRPLIAYSIEEAKQSKHLTRCIVSTDSQEIAQVAKEYGADVPFLRPEELATDTALSVSVMKHAIEEVEAQTHERYDIVVLLQPTTPLRLASDIDDAVQKILETGCDSVVSMVDVGACHPARMYEIKDDRLVSLMDEGVTMRPRQELPKIFIRSGDVYACKRDVVLQKNSLIGDDCRAIIIPSERSVNIDEMKDLMLTEYFLNQERVL